MDHFLMCTHEVYPELPKQTATGLSNLDAVLKNRSELIGEVFELEEYFSWQPMRTADKEWQIVYHLSTLFPERRQLSGRLQESCEWRLGMQPCRIA